MRELVPDLMLLFSGYDKAYGQYGGKLADEGGGKLKGKASTVKADVTIELWMSHLAGKMGLGIIPIRADSKVRFAAIDIDEYPLDLMKLNENIQRLKLPLVLCRTKSGGAHLFCFLDTFYPAIDVVKKMRDFSALLGYGNAEIFPKQTSISAERGDVGSWINMPYYEAYETNRHALDNEGHPIAFDKFLKYASSKIVTIDELHATKSANDELLSGGPPCLNHLCSMGFPAGTRNGGLFNIAVYLKKVHGEDWQQHLPAYNLKYMSPPLADAEVQGVIKSLAKKEFNYTCKQVPISNYCNMPKCRACKYGVGQGDLGMPKFGSLTKICSEPPVWFLEIEGGGRLELETDDLQNPRRFQQRCMSVLNVMPIMPKPGEWQEIVHKLLSEVCEVPIPFEATPGGMLWQQLEDFLTGRVQAKVVDELVHGKPWLNNGFYYFRLRDFQGYLERQRFKAVVPHVISVHLSMWKFGKKFWNIRGKGVNTYMIEADRFTKVEGSTPIPQIIAPEKILS